MATGKIVQVIGAVVDVEFPQDAVPRVYDALEVQNGNERLVLEVQQQLGGGIVRTIAMGSSDGLRRGRRKPAERLRSCQFSTVQHPPGNHVLLRTEPETAAQRTSAHTVSVSAVRSLSDRGQAAYVLHRQGRMQTERTLPVHDTVPERYGYHRTVFS